MSTLAATNLKNEASASNNIVLNADGTVSLNGSFSGNINFDSGTLYVDATNNRVGIGTTGPSQLLHLVGGSTTNPSILLAETGGSSLQIISGASDSFIGTNGSTPLRFGTGFTERARIDTSGRLLVGTSTSRTVDSTQSVLQIESGFSPYASARIASFFNNIYGPLIQLSHSRSDTVGSNTIVQNGDSVGGVAFYGADGTNYIPAALIRAQIDGTPGANDMPGRLVFSTCSDGSASPSERWRIDSSGSLVGVAGSAFVAPYIYNTTTASAANVNVSSAGFLYRSTSSIKYKENVRDATHGLAELLQLRPVTYTGKSETDGSTVFGGLIAEEVDAVGLSEFVQYAEDGSPDALAYGNMVSLCVKAIQEQQAVIEELQAKVAVLEGV